VFTDIEGNVLTEQFDDEEDTSNDENTIASKASENITEHISYTEEQVCNNQDNDDSRNVQTDTENIENNNTNNDDEVSTQPDQLPTKPTKEDDNNNNDEDNVSNMDTGCTDEPMEDPYEDWITIDDINIVTEMNTLQMAIQQAEENQKQTQTHGYNLRAQPTKRKE